MTRPSTSSTYTIDGREMTMAEIVAACPGITRGTLRSRIAWGWNTLEKLKQPVMPGRYSPWRQFNPHIWKAHKSERLP